MSSQGSQEEAQGRYLAALSLTALGIVFGDIGTSPIYALRSPSIPQTESTLPKPTSLAFCH